MGAIDEEFEETLSGLREKFRARPDRELEQLLLLALEREQLVTVAYRNDLMASRLEETSLDPELIRVFKHSLAWAWKDEQMHAIYTRGLLFRWGRPWVRFGALVQQLAGSIGGWASSVTQHVTWSRAPLARLLAAAVTWAGRMGGKVPRAVRKELWYLTFKEFCEFQVGAEATAALCWKRLSELSGSLSRVDASTKLELERMWHDEVSHRRVFETIATSLARSDVRPNAVSKLRDIDEYFVPREHRSGSLAAHPLGAGGRVQVMTGAPELEKRTALRQLLEPSELERKLKARASELGKPVDKLRVLVKATFMLGYDRNHTAVITDPELVDELARFLKGCGVSDIVVGEGRNIYDQYCEHRDVRRVAEYFGYDSTHYQVVDLSADQVPHRYPRGMAQDTLSRSWRDAEFRIVFAKMRSHPVDFTHLTIGGIQGVGERLEQFLFLERSAHRDTALLMPLTEFPPDFALIDGYASAADGLVGIIACPRFPKPHRLYAGADALAVDMVATRHMGLANPRASVVLDAACHWFGDPTDAIEVVGMDEPLSPWRSPYANGWTSFLSLLANPVYQFASARGETFLPPMDVEAFPPKNATSSIVRVERALLRKLLGMV